MSWLLIIALTWIGLLLLIVAAYAPTLRALWREPVLRHPVLIVESDDWGAGPLEQAQALRCLADQLSGFRDTTGHPPVVTLALVLAVPNGAAIRASGEYCRRTLEDPLFTLVREAIQEGVKRGVFALQLHGLEHYWPATLMASQDEAVQEWLTQEHPEPTEPLPSHLQSRWTDASVLPSRPLPEAAIRSAAREEITQFQHLFGHRPRVAVPPTFVWDTVVEAAWSEEGIEYVVTPGRRNTCRDADGKPGCAGGRLRNGETGQGVSYLVRDDYFEPMMGHTAENALAALTRKTRRGRPCLLETHRANFIDDHELARRSEEELSRLYKTALQTYPHLRFISTEALGQALRTQDPEWVEHRVGRRLAITAGRLAEIPRLGRLARLSGLAALLMLVAALLGHNEKIVGAPSGAN